MKDKVIMINKIIEINRSSPVPVYFQIATDLKNRIIRHEWNIDEKLPTEVELSEQYNVSRITLRQALAELEKDGILKKQRGKGTFIASDPAPFVTELNYTLVTGDKIMQTPNAITAKILEQCIVTDLFPAVAEHLQLNTQEKAVYIKRLFMLKDKPLAIGRSYISAKYVPNMEARSLVNNSISSTLQQYYSLVPEYVEDYIEAVRATQSDSALLSCSPDVPLILISGTSYFSDHKALEYSTALWCGDSVRFHLPLRRGKNGFIID